MVGGAADELVHATGELADAVGWLMRPSEPACLADVGTWEVADIRRRGQVMAAIGAEPGDHPLCVRVPRRVADAASLAAYHPDADYYRCCQCWKSPAFRAAVREHAHPGWGVRLASAIDAALVLGGPDAVGALFLSELPRLESAEDRRRRYDEARELREHMRLEAMLAQGDNDEDATLATGCLLHPETE